MVSGLKLYRVLDLVVDAGLLIAGKDHSATISAGPLQQVVDLDVRVATVAVLDLGALSEQRIGLIEEQNRLPCATAESKTAERFFSVSPMYLLTSCAVSTRNTSAPSSRASSWAAMVLPAPPGPVKWMTASRLVVRPGWFEELFSD